VTNADERTQTIAVKGAGRYVRLRSLERPANYFAGKFLYEFEVFGPDSKKTNLALRQPARTSPHGTPRVGGHDATKAVDGEPSTYWANDYRSRRVVFRDNVALVTANPIKIGTGSEYAGEDILWENHDVVDAGYSSGPGLAGGGMINFSHYNLSHTPHEMAMTGIRIRNARFEDTTGFVQVGWFFARTQETYWFATKLEAVLENVTFDRVEPGVSVFQVLANEKTAEIRLKFINLKVEGKTITSFDDLAAAGVRLDLRGLNEDDLIEFLVEPDKTAIK
jgi:hypothetical protein